MAITVSNNKPTIFSKFIFSGQHIYLNQGSDFYTGKSIVSIYSVLFSERNDYFTTVGDISNL